MKKKTRATVLLIHGGCGSTPPTAAQLKTIETALDRGERLLQKGASALDAVEAAVVVLEKSGRFNAGKGSKRQMDGVIRTDASVMNGRDLSAGAVAAMEGILTPIRAARLVMERTPHLLLVGISAEGLARLFRLPPLSPSLAAPTPPSEELSFGKWEALFRKLQGAKKNEKEKRGTVGAVARDTEGNVAAGTSTGGIRLMLPGRVGDSPLIGAGTYADNRSGAVSMTGLGEAIIRAGLAKEITLEMERGVEAEEAGRRALIRMRRRIGGEAGAIILSADGGFALLHTTDYMPGGYRAGRRRKVGGQFQKVMED
ncbi:MAG: isoaspartyl peptidase/L-asparaginase family protein [Candidatus Manganitrophus sp.]|nr:isoaspartyl peptidase/L-asparaginase family protein [Candidatus Manganitrophus sp.]MDC4224772.1 isoaspartyl peptidase/L-asparaginase family protein [Candidatus Manganitrophus sp.]